VRDERGDLQPLEYQKFEIARLPASTQYLPARSRFGEDRQQTGFVVSLLAKTNLFT